MNIDQLKKQFPNEDACRLFFESILWKHGRMRIPLKLTSHSGGYLPPVPFYCDQLFRCKLST